MGSGHNVSSRLVALRTCSDSHLFIWLMWAGVGASWNVMAYAQKPDFVFRRNRQVHLNCWGRQFSRLLAAEVCASTVVESSWNVMAHGRKSEGETREWSGWPVPFTLPRNTVYPALLPLMRTPLLPVVNWTDAPADLNGLDHFAERRNLVSARVPSHFKRSLQPAIFNHRLIIVCHYLHLWYTVRFTISQRVSLYVNYNPHTQASLAHCTAVAAVPRKRNRWAKFFE